jgi:hypothetical protein
MLRSRDINMTILNKMAKNRAQGLPSIKSLKIIRKDYLVEILSVRLQVRVNIDKNADNNLLA